MPKFDGFQLAVEALQLMDESKRKEILLRIAKMNPKMALRLHQGLFSFDHIEYLLKEDFKVIWWEVPKKTWHLALRKTTPGIMKMFEQNLSVRAYQTLLEEIEGLGPQKLSEVVKAQHEISDTIRRLAGEGRMALPQKNNDRMV
ncbi:MAG: hypothetical protein BroJett040_10600 [Oligoflexia bacterium]|nr:MAG: hypothetical protein BroJett040_10600 [Oligoflexia bacterium]